MVLVCEEPVTDAGTRLNNAGKTSSSDLLDFKAAEHWQCESPSRNLVAKDGLAGFEGLPGRSQSANSCMQCFPHNAAAQEGTCGTQGSSSQGDAGEATSGIGHSRSCSSEEARDMLFAGDESSDSSWSPSMSPDRKGLQGVEPVTKRPSSKDPPPARSACRSSSRGGSQTSLGDSSPTALPSLRDSTSSSSIDSLDETPASGVSAVVCPAGWTPRQLMLATEGLRQLPNMTSAELKWWIHARLCAAFIVSVQYASHYIIVLLLGLPWVLGEAEKVALVYCTYAVLYFTLFFSTTAARDGSQEAPKFKSWYSSLMAKASVMHFCGGVKLLRDTAEPLPATSKYIFSYHPHGLLPAMLAWISWSDAWGKILPGVRPVGLVATAVFRVPILRNLSLWGGLRDVSKTSFVKALHDAGSVIFCPGGQAELSLHLPSHKKRVVLSGRKTGFIRVALEAGASLVPVAVFGEAQLLDNFIDFPAAQRITYKLLGFPIPFIPVGILGLLPLPKKGKVAMVIGKPFHPRKFRVGSNASAEKIEAIRCAYYQEVISLYDKYKGQLGYGEWSFSIDHKR